MSSVSSKKHGQTARHERLKAAYLELLAAGHSVPQAAGKLGVTERTIHRIKAELGVRHGPPPNPRKTPEELRQIEELLEDGCSYKETARTLRINEQTIRRNFPGRGWTPHEAGKYSRMLDKLKQIELGG